MLKVYDGNFLGLGVVMKVGWPNIGVVEADFLVGKVDEPGGRRPLGSKPGESLWGLTGTLRHG